MNNVRDFGAVGDGAAKDTAAIQKALDAGGMAYVPPGTYLTGTLYLHSFGGLELAPGATLLGSPDPADYNADDFCVQNRPMTHEGASGAHLIVGCEVSHVTIRGGGTIDGNRAAFYHELTPDHPGKFKLEAWRPAQMIYFVESDHIVVRDVELNHAPYWSCFLHGCDEVTLDGVRVFNDQRTRNGDGFDLDCCTRVMASNCDIDSGDDCIAIRANRMQLKDRSRESRGIVISNCILKTCCNAFRIGVGDGVIRDVTVSNIVIRETRTGICIVSKYAEHYPGVAIDNVLFDNIVMDCVRPFNLASNIRGTTDESTQAPIGRITFSNIRGRATRSSLLIGNPDCRLGDIDFRNIDLIYSGGGDIVRDGHYAEFGPHRAAPAGFYLENVHHVTLEDVRLAWLDADPRFEYGVIGKNTCDIRIRNSEFHKPNQGAFA